MLQMAQDMLKLFQDRVRTTLRVMADLAESVGVPPAFTTLLTGRERAACVDEQSWGAPAEAEPQPALARPRIAEEPAEDNGKPRERRRPDSAAADRGATGVRGLRVDDAINGSTYLARIIWSLGVADLEGMGPLRPADMARMIMSRSAVSLEPPNVARYIRRSKPTCIEVARTEGSSSFYALNAEGHDLFDELFRGKK